MLYLASQIVVAGHISQGIKILFVTAIPVTTFATFGITVVVLIASIDTWHTNSVSYFSSFVMSKTLCWSSQHYWTVYIFSTQFQRLWVWCLENKKRLWESQKSKTLLELSWSIPMELHWNRHLKIPYLFRFEYFISLVTQ